MRITTILSVVVMFVNKKNQTLGTPLKSGLLRKLIFVSQKCYDEKH